MGLECELLKVFFCFHFGSLGFDLRHVIWSEKHRCGGRGLTSRHEVKSVWIHGEARDRVQVSDHRVDRFTFRNYKKKKSLQQREKAEHGGSQGATF